jgi:hypothetical protein
MKLNESSQYLRRDVARKDSKRLCYLIKLVNHPSICQVMMEKVPYPCIVDSKSQLTTTNEGQRFPLTGTSDSRAGSMVPRSILQYIISTYLTPYIRVGYLSQHTIIT